MVDTETGRCFIWEGREATQKFSRAARLINKARLGKKRRLASKKLLREAELSAEPLIQKESEHPTKVRED